MDAFSWVLIDHFCKSRHVEIMGQQWLNSRQEAATAFLGQEINNIPGFVGDCHMKQLPPELPAPGSTAMARQNSPMPGNKPFESCCGLGPGG